MKNQLVQRVVILGGLGLFAGLSLLNMQTYLALAAECYKLVKILPFAWWITPQILPMTLAIAAGAGFFIFRSKKLNPFLLTLMSGSCIVLFILAMTSEQMAVSSFGLLLWLAFTAAQTAPFWVKTFFFDSIRSAFRNHPVEVVQAGDSEAVKSLTEKRNALPQEILSGFTKFAVGANAVDIGLGIWQYPIISLANLTALNFTLETIAIDSVLKVVLLSVLPEVLLFAIARILYLCSIGGAKGANSKQGKRQNFSTEPQARQQEPRQREQRRGNPFQF